jgi:hypothetical protein
MKAYIVKKYVLVHDWAPHPVHISLKTSSKPCVFTILPLLWKIMYFALDALADVLLALYQVTNIVKVRVKLGKEFR